MRVGGQTIARVATLINSHPRLTGPLYHTSCIYSFRKKAQKMAYLRSRFFCRMFLVLYAILSTVETSQCSYSNGRHYCYGAKHCCAKRKE